MVAAIPQFDPAAVIEYRLAMTDADLARYASGSSHASSASSDEQVVYCLSHLPVKNRTIKLKKITMALVRTGAACVQQGIWLQLLRKNSFNVPANGDMLDVILSLPIDTTQRTGAGTLLFEKDNINELVTLPNVADGLGGAYDHLYWGLAVHKTGASSGVGSVRTPAAFGPSGCRFAIAAAEPPSTGSTVTVANASETYSYFMQLVFETPDGKLSSITASGSPEGHRLRQWAMARTDGGPQYCAMQSLRANNSAADASMKIDAYNLGAGAANNLAFTPVEFSWSSGTNVVKCHGVSNNLAGNEAPNDYFNAYWWRNGTKHDLYYCNTTHGQGGVAGDGRDRALLSHKTRNAGQRGLVYEPGNDLSAVSVLHVNRSTSNGSVVVEVGTDPLVVMSDSRYLSTLASRFTHPRIVIPLNIDGNFLNATTAYSTAAYLRYRHGTPGQGDVCEMRDAILVFAGLGVNDAAGSALAPETYKTRFDGIIDDWRDDALQSHRDLLLLGVAPVDSNYANAAAINARITAYNAAIRAQAVQQSVTLFDPYDLVALNEDAYLNQTDYLHYTTAGEAALSTALAASYEAGLAPSLPTVATAAAVGVSIHVATLGGNVTDSGVPPLCGVPDTCYRDVAYGEAEDPVIEEFDLTNPGTGPYTKPVTDLSAKTLYHCRAAARNALGDSYGADVAFSTRAPGGGLLWRRHRDREGRPVMNFIALPAMTGDGADQPVTIPRDHTLLILADGDVQVRDTPKPDEGDDTDCLTIPSGTLAPIGPSLGQVVYLRAAEGVAIQLALN